MKKRGLSLLLSLALVFTVIPAASADGPRPTVLNLITPAMYDELGEMSEGLIWARQGGQFSVLDADGNTVISPAALEQACGDVYDVRGFHEGKAAVYGERGTTYIDDSGKAVFTVEWGHSFSDATAVGWTEDGLALWDGAGVPRYVTLPAETAEYDDWDCGVQFNEGLLPFWVVSGNTELCGYVDKDFNLVIPLRFEDARPFYGGLAPVKENGKWGFIDKTGSYVIEPQYEDYMASDADYRHVAVFGLAAVKKDGKWGYIDNTGNVHVPFVWDYAELFSADYAVVGSDGKYGYIDTLGQVVIPVVYDDANPFDDGAALVGSGGNYWLIGADGSRLTQSDLHFDATVTSLDHPWLVTYQSGGKWGIAHTGDPLDSADSWAHAHIQEALEKGYIPQSLQHSFRQPITRGEFVTLAVRWLEWQTGKDYQTLVAERGGKSKAFTDTTDPVILAGASLSITAGVSEDRFGPEQSFNRQQAAVMLCKVMEILGWNTKNADDYGYTDILDADGWARDAVNYVSQNRVMTGKSTTGKFFDPRGTFSRQESIITFNKLG